MKLNEAVVLVEGISGVLYHATTVPNLKSIVNDNKFHLSPTFIKDSEGSFSKKLWYFSTTRSRYGSYHRDINNYMALIRLDGRKLSERYSGRPIDYWRGIEGFSDKSGKQLGDEYEDRIMTDSPVIDKATSYMTQVDFLVPGYDLRRSVEEFKRLVSLVNTLQKMGIPCRVYDEQRNWLMGNSKFMDFKELVAIRKAITMGHEPEFEDDRLRGRINPYTLMAFRALKFNTVREMRDSIGLLREYVNNYEYQGHRVLSGPLYVGFGVGDRNRNMIIQISRMMRQLNLTTMEELGMFIYNKWRNNI